MGKDDIIEVNGTVIEPLPNAKFKVEINDEPYEGLVVTGHLAGKMRVHFIKTLSRAPLTIELSTYDLTKGRITYRHKPERRSNQ